MERRWYNNKMKDLRVAFVSDSDADILRFGGYEHCQEEDFIDEIDGELVEVWKPVKREKKIEYGVATSKGKVLPKIFETEEEAIRYRDRRNEFNNNWKVVSREITYGEWK